MASPITNIFSILPLDIAGEVGKYLDPSSIYSVRLTCKDYKNITDIILKKLWFDLKKSAPEGVVDIQNAMAEIADNDPNIDKPLSCFRKLAEKFVQNGVEISRELPITALQFTDLQNQPLEQDKALVAIWPEIATRLGRHDPRLYTAKGIRYWLDNNPALLDGIVVLNLSCLQLKVLPREIANFKKLIKLDLSANELESLPDAIRALTELQKLDLFSNKLKTLPDAIGALINLEELDLFSNELKTLPDAIGFLTKLQKLELYGNQLKTLPDAIKALTGLEYLSFGAQFESLPDAIGDLTRLKYLSAYKNPLMFISDKILSSNCAALQENTTIKDFKKELEYPSQSSLARLYQAIIRRKSEDEIKSLFSTLSPNDKNRIFKMV